MRADSSSHRASSTKNTVEIETVEAEVVFLIRNADQWPLHQTEIHFHPSTQVHREAAAAVMSVAWLRDRVEVNGTC
jgi:hypothetical protein